MEGFTSVSWLANFELSLHSQDFTFKFDNNITRFVLVSTLSMPKITWIQSVLEAVDFFKVSPAWVSRVVAVWGWKSFVRLNVGRVGPGERAPAPTQTRARTNITQTQFRFNLDHCSNILESALINSFMEASTKMISSILLFLNRPWVRLWRGSVAVKLLLEQLGDHQLPAVTAPSHHSVQISSDLPKMIFRAAW